MRRILITGASSGIGAATARACAGDHLVLVARRRERLEALSRELGNCTCLAADLADPAAFARVAAEAGPLDALVNNAGAFALAAGEALDAAHLETLWRINVTAPMLLTAACLPRMRPGATIVNLSSQVIDHTFSNCGAYTASKCAIEGWSRVLREELRPKRIRVTVVAPGATDTEIWPAEFAGADRTRMSQAADIAEAIRMAITAPASSSLDRIAITPPGRAL